MTQTTPSKDVPEFEHTNLPSDPRKSSSFHVPEYMHEPQVYPNLYGHHIRIWRSEAVDLAKTNDIRRCIGLVEFTNLETGLTLGLEWYYSLYQKKAWREFKYILYSHFPGEQPCKDLQDVYKSTTAEIKWVISRLKKKHGRKLKPAPMKDTPTGVFPT